MLQAAVGEGEQRSIKRALGVLQDGVVLVDVLHHFRVELVLLKGDTREETVEITSTETAERGERKKTH